MVGTLDRFVDDDDDDDDDDAGHDADHCCRRESAHVLYVVAAQNFRLNAPEGRRSAARMEGQHLSLSINDPVQQRAPVAFPKKVPVNESAMHLRHYAASCRLLICRAGS